MNINPALVMQSMGPHARSDCKTGQVCKKCYQIMHGICQAETHMTNMDLYHMTDEHPISEMIHEQQHLGFTRHCLCMPNDEPTNIYVLYQSKIRYSNHHGNPGLTYLNQISKYLSTNKTVRFSAGEIANYAKDKQLWNPSIAVHKLPNR